MDTIELNDMMAKGEGTVQTGKAAEDEGTGQINVPTFDAEAEPHAGEEREKWGSKLQVSFKKKTKLLGV